MKAKELEEGQAHVLSLLRAAADEKDTPLHAMQLTQAALNAANAVGVLSAIPDVKD